MNYQHSICVFICTLFLWPYLLGESLVYANETNFKPAQFEDDLASVGQRLRFPNKAIRDKVTIRCSAIASVRGNIHNLVCLPLGLQRGEYSPYLGVIVKAFKNIRATPAQVNGEKVNVIFNFSIVFDAAGVESSISILPNIQFSAEQYDNNYIDPQRILGDPQYAECRGQIYLTLTANISSSGMAMESKVLDGEESTECHQSLLELLINSQYVPAHSNGKIVEAIYVEVISKKVWGRLVVR